MRARAKLRSRVLTRAYSMSPIDADLLARFEGATVTVTSKEVDRAKPKVHHGCGSTSVCVMTPPKGWAKHTCCLRLADGRCFRIEFASFQPPEAESVLRMFAEHPQRFSKVSQP